MSRFTACVAIAVAIAATAPATAGASDLDAMNERELDSYVHERITELRTEAEAMERIASKHVADCRRSTPDVSRDDGARACEIVRAATARHKEIRLEEKSLLNDLAARYGTVPAWARRDDALFTHSVRHPLASPGAPTPAS